LPASSKKEHTIKNTVLEIMLGAPALGKSIRLFAASDRRF